MVPIWKYVHSLSAHYDPLWLKGYKEKSVSTKVSAALTSPDWLLQGRFVYWIACLFQSIQTWGEGCDRHHQEWLETGKVCGCLWMGHRLKTAYVHVTGVLKAALDEANSWTADGLGGSVRFLREAHGGRANDVRVGTPLYRLLEQVAVESR